MAEYSGYLGGYIGDQTQPVTPPTRTTGRGRARLYMAFENPRDAPTWREETDYLRSFSYHRGKSPETDEFTAATMSLKLANESRRFDSTYNAGPYFGALRPRRRVRLAVDLNLGGVAWTMRRSSMGGSDVIRGAATEITVFTGYTEGFPNQWDISDRDGTVDLNVTDGFILLNGIKFQNGFYLDADMNIGDAIIKVLALANWPGAVQNTFSPTFNDTMDIDEAEKTILTQTLVTAEETALAVLQKLALTEGGSVFMSREGRVTFRSSKHSSGSGTWGDAANELPYSDITDSPEDFNLFTTIKVNPDGQPTMVLTNAAAADLYGDTIRELNIFPVVDAQARGQEMLDKYSQPRKRIVGFKPQGKDQLGVWRTIVSRELVDTLDVYRRPSPNNDDPIHRQVEVDSISMSGAANKPGYFDVAWETSELFVAYPNIFDTDQASFESSDGGWLANTNCTVSRYTGTIHTGIILPGRPRHRNGNSLPPYEYVFETPVLDGVASLFAKPLVLGDLSVLSPIIPVTVGNSYICGMGVYAFDMFYPDIRFDILWLDVGNATVSTTTGSTTLSSSSQWAQIRNGPVSPPVGLGVVSAQLKVYVTGPTKFNTWPGVFIDAAYFKINLVD